MTEALVRPDVAAPVKIQRGRRRRWWLTLLAGAAGLEVLIDQGGSAPRIAAGFFICLVLPVGLLRSKVRWPAAVKVHEALLYSIGLVLLGFIVLGLAMNQLLPLVGIDRPLSRFPLTIGLLVAVGVLGCWRTRTREPSAILHGLRATPSRGNWREQVLAVSGVAAIVGAIAGATRLNNGSSGALTLGVLILLAVMLVFTFTWRRRIDDLAICVAIYCTALSVLFMTSLRGWYVTGHDIQREFRVFELVSTDGIWQIQQFRDAYNACMSVTILPTMLARGMAIPDLLVFKVLYQSLYALCPVIIYLIARRMTAKLTAMLAAVYFVAFPTFFTDMPFLNRQEIAFFFLGLALLAATHENLSLTHRRLGFVLASMGVLLSHYSTTYVLIAILVVAWALGAVWRLGRPVAVIRRIRTNGSKSRHRTSSSKLPVVVNAAVIVGLGLATYAWVEPITDTGGQVEETFAATAESLRGIAGGGRSGDVAYTIFGGTKPTPEKRLSDYRAQTGGDTEEERAANGLYPLSEVNKYRTPIAAPSEIPVTALGAAVEETGLRVSDVNGYLRSGAPLMLQLFVGVGILVAALGFTQNFGVSREFFLGAIACGTVITLQVILPNVSVDYGVLRTFAQGMFWLAPFLALGSVQVFVWLGPAAAKIIAVTLATVFFLSQTGVIPQLLGGYPAQLHLNNSGPYYDIYYAHPQEIYSIRWLQEHLAGDQSSAVQSEVATDKYAIKRLQNYSAISASDDVFPIRIRKNAIVYLGFTAVNKGQVTFSYIGDLITYDYPKAFLDNNKNLIYSSDGSQIYQ